MGLNVFNVQEFCEGTNFWDFSPDPRKTWFKSWGHENEEEEEDDCNGNNGYDYDPFGFNGNGLWGDFWEEDPCKDNTGIGGGGWIGGWGGNGFNFRKKRNARNGDSCLDQEIVRQELCHPDNVNDSDCNAECDSVTSGFEDDIAIEEKQFGLFYVAADHMISQIGYSNFNHTYVRSMCEDFERVGIKISFDWRILVEDFQLGEEWKRKDFVVYECEATHMPLIGLCSLLGQIEFTDEHLTKSKSKCDCQSQDALESKSL